MANKHNIKQNKERLLIELSKSLGIVSIACKAINLSRNQFYIYYNNDIEFKASVDDITEVALDFAESKLLEKIKEGSEKSIHFYLSKKGKSRGYGDKVDLNITNDKVKFKFNFGEIDGIENDEDETEGVQ